MPEPQAAAPATSSQDFASLLAKLASPSTALTSPAEPWDDSALADDIATFSYEHTLRTHSHFPAIRSFEPSIQQTETVSSGSPSEEDRKGASISIRLSRTERAQLRQRAAEAGLTVSAYLRSCIFEAESLRTQVRDALSQFRSATTNSSIPATPPPSRPQSPKGKVRRLWPFGGRTQPSARTG